MYFWMQKCFYWYLKYLQKYHWSNKTAISGSQRLVKYVYMIDWLADKWVSEWLIEWLYFQLYKERNHKKMIYAHKCNSKGTGTYSDTSVQHWTVIRNKIMVTQVMHTKRQQMKRAIRIYPYPPQASTRMPLPWTNVSECQYYFSIFGFYFTLGCFAITILSILWRLRCQQYVLICNSRSQ